MVTHVLIGTQLDSCSALCQGLPWKATQKLQWLTSCQVKLLLGWPGASGLNSKCPLFPVGLSTRMCRLHFATFQPAHPASILVNLLWCSSQAQVKVA